MELISREATIELLKQMRKDGNMVPWEGKDVFAKIRELPFEHGPGAGHWIDYPECLQYEGAYSDDHHVCSKCFAVFSHMDNCMEDWHCCPNCGARMEESE